MKRPRLVLLSFESILSYFGSKRTSSAAILAMRAIIPVASVGSRLRPHTYAVPKVLLKVGGKPIVGHILDRVIENGFDEATILHCYLGNEGL